MSDEPSGADGTVCPFCAVGCRLTRDGEQVRGVAGPANPNGRLCEKGIRAFEPVDDSDRLTSPLVRRDGQLVSVSWESALDRVVSGFEGILDERGPDALAFLGAPRCTNEENYLLQKLARALGTNNVDNRARHCHAETARVMDARLGLPAMTNTLDDLHEADVFVVVGANPAARQPVAFDDVIRPTVADGATLVHVDPHRNETTRLADVHVAPRPGTDGLVVSTVCALVVEAGGVDRSFVRERTAGYDAFLTRVAERDISANAAAADVDEVTLRDVARRIADADRTAVLTGTGADEAATADALVNLLLLTGNLGRPGTGMNVLRGLNNEQGAVDVGCVPDWLPGHRSVTSACARDHVADECGYSPPSVPGASEQDLLADCGDDVAGALVVGENPAISKRDPAWITDHLDALDTLVVHELIPSETTEHADVVLPVAAGVEKAGTVTNLDRQVQRLFSLSSPPADVRTDFAVLRELGRRLVGEGFDYEGPRDVFDEITRVTPPYASLSYDDLAERSRRWPSEDGGNGSIGAASTGFLYPKSFATDGGRASFVTPALSTNETGDGALHLVVGDRAGEFPSSGEGAVDERLTVHPTDAETHDVRDAEPVVVENAAGTVTAITNVSEAVRPGTVYLHARVADPLTRSGETSVTLRPAESDH